MKNTVVEYFGHRGKVIATGPNVVTILFRDGNRAKDINASRVKVVGLPKVSKFKKERKQKIIIT